MERKRIAIVGSGVSGLAALWTLRDSPHEVHLFEQQGRLGGHTNTVTWTHNGQSTPVDTGFIVLNTATYPNFIEFLNVLGVRTVASQMTFGISRDGGAFEWSGTSLKALFVQSRNLISPSFWRMIFDIVRFNQFALDLLSTDPSQALSDMSIGAYLDREGYSASFRDDYLIPLTACVWSTGADKCALEFPALTLVRFMWNHHLLTTVSERPPWLTVSGGARQYIDAVISACKNAHVHLSTPVEKVSRNDGRVLLHVQSSHLEPTLEFDHVVLACHGDQARRLVSDCATQEEMNILDAFETTPNTAYLHSDCSLMPKRREAWSAWNYLTTSQRSEGTVGDAQSPSGALQTVSLTYNMNILQDIPTDDFGDVLVTLNPREPPLPTLTQGTYQYRHPLYNSRMIAAQDQLVDIQGNGGIWYAGAWTGYGFHEDGFHSGMTLGMKLGGTVPWKVQNAKFSRGSRPSLGWKDHVVRFLVSCIQHCIVIWVSTLSARTRGQGSNQVRYDDKATRKSETKSKSQ